MADLKERIARRCAKEFKDGEFANLGIGLPTQVADYIPEGVTVTFHSENGFAGIDAIATENPDVDIINSGGTYVTTIPSVKFFDTAESFGLVRGGHVRATVLGAMEVAENGDLANWIVPGKGFVLRLPGSYHRYAAHAKGRAEDFKKMHASADCRKMRFQNYYGNGRYGGQRGRHLGYGAASGLQ